MAKAPPLREITSPIDIPLGSIVGISDQPTFRLNSIVDLGHLRVRFVGVTLATGEPIAVSVPRYDRCFAHNANTYQIVTR